MKLLRITGESSPGRISAADFLAAGACDVLQLDWNRLETGDNLATFLAEWKKLHKFFFLDQRLRMITDAGAGGVYGCVESLGKYLCEHGDPQVPITAVRGENILPCLAGLSAAGFEFTDQLSGEKLPVASSELLSAQVQIGAGPIATALDEESRIVVLGCYDPVAPFLAAGVSVMGSSWTDYAILAELALASIVSEQFSLTAELADTGRVSLLPSGCGESSLVIIEEWLSKRSPKVMQWADVTCDSTALELSADEQGGLQMAGISASAPGHCWRVKLLFDGPQGQRRECWSEVPLELVNISVDTRAACDWL